MRVLAYNPETDDFFIGASFYEFLHLDKEYEIKENESSFEIAQQLVKEEKENISLYGSSFYFDAIRNMYGIDKVPDICFSVHRAATVLEIMEHDYPFGHMWNAYTPWIRINIIEINSLVDLFEIKCEERENANV